MLALSCPDKNRLSDYLQGRLSDDDSGSLVDHVAGCPRCEALAAQLEADDDWLTRHLRAAGDSPLSPDSPSWLPRVRDAQEESPSQHQIKDPHKNPNQDNPNKNDADQPLVLGAYQIKEVLGRGGMGVVCRAVHERLGKDVAVKVIASGSPQATADRFEREIRVVASLDHPSIVQATDAGTASGRAFLVMELVDGVDLRAILRRLGPLRTADACEIVRQAALGLASAHQDGVIHRDIKPSNLMLHRSGQIKILDFGLARMQQTAETMTMATSVGQLLGTLDYLAPEQTDGGDVDCRADIYALGATLYTLLAGRPPMGRSSDAPVLHHLRRLATEEAPPLYEFRPDAPLELTELTTQMLRREASQRIESATEVARLFEPFTSGHNLPALVEEAFDKAPTPTEEEHQQKAAKWLSELSDLVGAPQRGSDVADAQRPSLGSAGKIRRAALMGLISLLALCGGGWLGVTIYLNTGQGRLRIESQAENVTIRLLRNEKPVQTIEVQREEKSIKLRAGRYEIRIDEPSDQIRVSQRTVRVLRGEETLVTVTQEPAGAPGTPQPNDAQDSKKSKPLSLAQRLRSLDRAPLWEGKDPAQWLEILEKERQSEQISKAVSAVLGIVDALPRPLAAEMLLCAGAAAVRSMVPGDANRIALILAAEPELWPGALRSQKDPIFEKLTQLLRTGSEPLDRRLAAVIDKLAAMPVDDFVVLSPLIWDDRSSSIDRCAKTILLRVLLKRALTKTHSHNEARKIRGMIGHLNVNPEIDSLRFLVDGLFNESPAYYLRSYFGKHSKTVNSAEAVLALRLARRFADDQFGEKRLQAWAAAIANDQFGLAIPLHLSKLVRPVQASSKISPEDALVEAVALVLHGAMERPDWEKRFAQPDRAMMVKLNLLIDTCDQGGEMASSQTAKRLCERMLSRLAQWRGAARLTESMPAEEAAKRYLQLGEVFQRIADVQTKMTGKLPDALQQPVTGAGDLPKWFAIWQSRKSNDLQEVKELGLPDAATAAIGRWYPFQAMRSAYLGPQPDAIRQTGSWRINLAKLGIDPPRRLWLAIAANIAGQSKKADEHLASQLTNFVVHGGRIQPLTAAALAGRGQMVRELAGDFGRHRGMWALIDQLFKAAKSDLLKSAAAAIFFEAGLLNWRPEYLQALIKSDEPLAAYRAILWAGDLNSLTGRSFQKTAVDRLMKPGIVNVSEKEQPFILQRMLLLEKLPDKAIKEAVQQIAKELQSFGPTLRFRVGDQRAVMYPRYQAIHSHLMTPMLRLISRFPDIASWVKEDLQKQYEFSERRGEFSRRAGAELKQAFEKALPAASSKK